MRNGQSHFRNIVMTMLLCVPLLLVSPVRSYGYADPGRGLLCIKHSMPRFWGARFIYASFLTDIGVSASSVRRGA